MSDEQQKPPDEEAPATEAAVPDDVPDDEKDVSDEPDLSVEELRDEVTEIATRFRNAGLRPVRKVLRWYADNFLGAVEGLADALEGKKKGG